MHRIAYSFVIFFAMLAYACAAPEAKTEVSTAPAHAVSTAAAKSPAAAADHPDIEVVQIAFATSISSMMPVNASMSFDDSVRTVYFWNRLHVKRPPARVKHIWYLNDQKTDEFQLDIRYTRTRLWTHKNVKPGLWKVEVADADGNVIMTGAFVVKKRGE